MQIQNCQDFQKPGGLFFYWLYICLIFWCQWRQLWFYWLVINSLIWRQRRQCLSVITRVCICSYVHLVTLIMKKLYLNQAIMNERQEPADIRINQIFPMFLAVVTLRHFDWSKKTTILSQHWVILSFLMHCHFEKRDGLIKTRFPIQSDGVSGFKC